jgi:hypothetical protein
MHSSINFCFLNFIMLSGYALYLNINIDSPDIWKLCYPMYFIALKDLCTFIFGEFWLI